MCEYICTRYQVYIIYIPGMYVIYIYICIYIYFEVHRTWCHVPPHLPEFSGDSRIYHRCDD